MMIACGVSEREKKSERHESKNYCQSAYPTENKIIHSVAHVPIPLAARASLAPGADRALERLNDDRSGASHREKNSDSRDRKD